jgi:cytochrome c2
MPKSTTERLLDWRVLVPLLGVILVGGAVAVEMHEAREKAALATTLTGGDPSRAPALMTRYGCAGCHAIDGIPGADGQVGPPLKQLIERVYIGGAAPNNAGNLVGWLLDPPRFAPHTAMPPPGLSETEARDIAAYLYAH